MDFRDWTTCILDDIKQDHEDFQIAEKLGISENWIKTFREYPEQLSLNEFLALIKASGKQITLDPASMKVEVEKPYRLEESHGGILLSFQYGTYKAKTIIPGGTQEVIKRIERVFVNDINNKQINKKEAVANSFFEAVKLLPEANPSDIWFFLLPKLFQCKYHYQDYTPGRNFEQSWKRTSGWALEEIVIRNYYSKLLKHNIEIKPGSNKKEIQLWLDSLSDDNERQESDKVDLLLVHIDESSQRKIIFGVIHVKASFAERRTDDVPLSKFLIKNNLFSPLITMDCKAFPSENPKNLGELGSVGESESAKRMDIEDEMHFSACYSFNSNTVPTPKESKKPGRIHIIKTGGAMNSSQESDAFIQDTIKARNLYINHATN